MAKKAPKIAREARLAAEKWRDYFRQNNNQYHDMFEFVLGKQWKEDEQEVLKTFKKVPLQFNKLGALINSLLGEQQQNTPQIEVVPMAGCDEETAALREVIVKDIMLGCDPKTVYQVAAMQSFVGGFGAFAIDTDYVHEKSFDQEIVYRHFKDATMCYWDIGAERVDKTDGMYCGYLVRMSRAKFKEKYSSNIEANIKNTDIAAGQEEIAMAVSSNSSGQGFNWADDDGITLQYDFQRKYEPDTLYKLSNGDTVNKEEMDEIVEYSREVDRQIRVQERLQMGLEVDESGEIIETEEVEVEVEEVPDEFLTLYVETEAVRIEDQRNIKRSKIMHRIIAGEYILDETEFPASDLPVVFMDQNSYYNKHGKQMCRPFVQDAVDSQRYLNYLGTQSAYILKVSRFDQWIGSKKNVQSLDSQQKWKNPENVQGMLTYDESPSGARPEQVRPPELSQSLYQQYQRALEDIHTSTGMYGARLGEQGNEMSGSAIDARTRQGSYSTYVAFNSVNRAITSGGRIVNQMIPRVYDTERVMTLMTPDKGRQDITVNQAMDEYGSRIQNDLTKGTYEVRLQAGPSYEGQKAQALESLNMVLAANPQMITLLADLYAENLPLTNTLEITNRLKTIVPKEILEAGKTGQMPDEQQVPNAQEQAAMAQAKMKQEEIEIKKQELQLKIEEAEAKNEIAQMQLEMKRLETLGKLEAEKLRYLAETDRTQSDNAISHADNLTKILTTKMKEM